MLHHNSTGQQPRVSFDCETPSKPNTTYSCEEPTAAKATQAALANNGHFNRKAKPNVASEGQGRSARQMTGAPADVPASKAPNESAHSASNADCVAQSTHLQAAQDIAKGNTAELPMKMADCAAPGASGVTQHVATVVNSIDVVFVAQQRLKVRQGFDLDSSEVCSPIPPSSRLHILEQRTLLNGTRRARVALVASGSGLKSVGWVSSISKDGACTLLEEPHSLQQGSVAALEATIKEFEHRYQSQRLQRHRNRLLSPPSPTPRMRAPPQASLPNRLKVPLPEEALATHRQSGQRSGSAPARRSQPSSVVTSTGFDRRLGTCCAMPSACEFRLATASSSMLWPHKLAKLRTTKVEPEVEEPPPAYLPIEVDIGLLLLKLKAMNVKLGDELAQWDRSGDGTISPGEFSLRLRQLGIQGGQKEIAELFQKMGTPQKYGGSATLDVKVLELGLASLYVAPSRDIRAGKQLRKYYQMRADEHTRFETGLQAAESLSAQSVAGSGSSI